MGWSSIFHCTLKLTSLYQYIPRHWTKQISTTRYKRSMPTSSDSILCQTRLGRRDLTTELARCTKQPAVCSPTLARVSWLRVMGSKQRPQSPRCKFLCPPSRLQLQYLITLCLLPPLRLRKSRKSPDRPTVSITEIKIRFYLEWISQDYNARVFSHFF